MAHKHLQRVLDNDKLVMVPQTGAGLTTQLHQISLQRQILLVPNATSHKVLYRLTHV